MKNLCLAMSLLMVGCASQPPVIAESIPDNASIPLDPLLQCSANALRVYDLPPRIAISLACEREITELEAWAADFAERTGLTLEEVEYIISEATAE